MKSARAWMSPLQKQAPSIEKYTNKLLNIHILVALTVGVFIAYICRVNISFAALQMNQDLGIGAEVFGTSVGLLFVAYGLFEIPSAYILVRLGSRVWLSAILCCWGLATIATAFVKNVETLYILRFLVGAAEAGFPASCAYCIAQWYPQRRRGQALAIWMSGGIIASALASPLCGAMMSINGAGLRGWQWMFILTGIPTVLLAAIVLKNFAAGPDGARWLPEASREWLKGQLRRDASSAPAHSKSFGSAFRTPATWTYLALVFMLNLAGVPLIFWLPQLVKAEFSGLSVANIGIISAMPFVVGVLTTIFFRGSNRRTGDTRWHITVFLWAAAISLAIGMLIGTGASQLFGMIVGISCYVTCIITVFSLPMSVLSGAAVASALAIINSGGQLGAVLGSYSMGLMQSRTGELDVGIYATASIFLLASVIPVVFATRFPAPPVPEEDVPEPLPHLVRNLPESR